MAHRLRRLAALSAGLTYVLILLGVYTAAAGAGLTCDARWPLCDGAVFGLFPADWPSFVEWFHRLVAMTTGVVVLGTTVAAFRGESDRRVRGALAVATLLLPAQIVLGGLTVTRYEWAILTAHFVTALTIFTGVLLAALWTTDVGATRERVREATAGAALAGPALVAFTPRLLFVYDAPVQVAYYAVGLAAYAALLAATTWTESLGRRRVRLPTAAGAAVLFALLVTGRQVFGDAGQAAALTGGVLAAALAALAAWLTRRGDGGDTGRGVPGDD